MRMCRVQDIATRYTDCETAAGAAAHPRLREHRASGALSSWQRFDKGPWERPLRRQLARYDYEYERNGTANLFMMFAPLEGWRHVKVTDRHTAVDYAHVLKELSDTRFPDAEKIILVQDNLNTHTPASLYEAFQADEA